MTSSLLLLTACGSAAPPPPTAQHASSEAAGDETSASTNDEDEAKAQLAAKLTEAMLSEDRVTNVRNHLEGNHQMGALSSALEAECKGDLAEPKRLACTTLMLAMMGSMASEEELTAWYKERVASCNARESCINLVCHEFWGFAPLLEPNLQAALEHAQADCARDASECGFSEVLLSVKQRMDRPAAAATPDAEAAPDQ